MTPGVVAVLTRVRVALLIAPEREGDLGDRAAGCLT